jgi:hypothetical protein
MLCLSPLRQHQSGQERAATGRIEGLKHGARVYACTHASRLVLQQPHLLGGGRWIVQWVASQEAWRRLLCPQPGSDVVIDRTQARLLWLLTSPEAAHADGGEKDTG